MAGKDDEDAAQEPEQQEHFEDGLLETITDPLSSVERDALTQLRRHEAAVGALRSGVVALRQRAFTEGGSTSIAELRRIAQEAEKVEALLGIPPQVLARDALAQGEWPAADLAQARAVLAAVDAYEAATQAARSQISAEVEETPSSTPSWSSVCQALEKLLDAWSGLRAAELEAQKHTELAVSRVNLAVEAHGNAIRPLCDALMDKVIEVHTSLSQKAVAPGVVDPDGTISSDDAVGLAVFTGRLRALFQQKHIQEAIQTLQLDMPSHELFQVSPEEPEIPEWQKPKEHGAEDDIEKLGKIEEKVEEIVEPTMTTMATTDALSVSPPLGPTTVLAPAAELDDALMQTVPDAGCSGPMASGSQSTATLWHAVHVGDKAEVQTCIDGGACTGKMRDASGHSVLWHAIAFNHPGIAELMLDNFPPGTAQGVDVGEIHPRKGDSLLHLLCQSKSFGTEAAALFKRITKAIPTNIFWKVNRVGLTFLQIAASSLNFWVLTFVLRNFPVEAKALVCLPGKAVLKALAEALPQPMAPVFVPPAPLPEHFRMAEMMRQEPGSGAVPYADVAFDVGKTAAAGDDASSPAQSRFLAHRLVVVIQSPVLFQALEKLPLTELPGDQTKKIRAAIFRVDPRISQDVWQSVLHFMYTGAITCAFRANAEKMVELLRACVLYQLPRPLQDFAQACLYPLLVSSPASIALQVFSICAGSAAEEAELRPARDASAYIILRSAHQLFEAVAPKEAAAILEKVIQTSENTVFNPPTPPEQPTASSSSAAGRAPDTPDTLSQSQWLPQSLGSAWDMRGLQGLPHDALSQSMRGMAQVPPQVIGSMPCGYNQGYPQHTSYPEPPGARAQAYGRMPPSMNGMDWR